jgi:hypothetical protein
MDKQYVEDSSGNGTLVNQTHLLRKGEKRVLKGGDEICLVNPQTLKKKMQSETALEELLKRYSFVYISVEEVRAWVSTESYFFCSADFLTHYCVSVPRLLLTCSGNLSLCFSYFLA